jgi:hypothetical protein
MERPSRAPNGTIMTVEHEESLQAKQAHDDAIRMLRDGWSYSAACESAQIALVYLPGHPTLLALEQQARRGMEHEAIERAKPHKVTVSLRMIEAGLPIYSARQGVSCHLACVYVSFRVPVTMYTIVAFNFVPSLPKPQRRASTHSAMCLRRATGAFRAPSRLLGWNDMRTGASKREVATLNDKLPKGHPPRFKRGEETGE